NGSRGSTEASHDQQGWSRQDRRRTESEMGGAEKATGATSPTGEAQETEVLGGRFESHKGSHEKALGGLPQSQESRGVGPTPGPHHGSAPRSQCCRLPFHDPGLRRVKRDRWFYAHLGLDRIFLQAVVKHWRELTAPACRRTRRQSGCSYRPPWRGSGPVSRCRRSSRRAAPS